jgi:hypothetical protein
VRRDPDPGDDPPPPVRELREGAAAVEDRGRVPDRRRLLRDVRRGVRAAGTLPAQVNIERGSTAPFVPAFPAHQLFPVDERVGV